MKPLTLTIAALFGLAGAMPAMALQPAHLATKAGNARGTIPLQVKDDQVAQMQQKLNDQGFDTGQVDGCQCDLNSPQRRDLKFPQVGCR